MEKKKRCTQCKKKKEITEAIPVVDLEFEIPPTYNEIMDLYTTMSNMKGVNPEEYNRINPIYKKLFQEDLLTGCGSCGATQYRKLKYFITEILKQQVD